MARVLSTISDKYTKRLNKSSPEATSNGVSDELVSGQPKKVRFAEQKKVHFGESSKRSKKRGSVVTDSKMSKRSKTNSEGLSSTSNGTTSDEPLYEVEEIIDHRINLATGLPVFLIKWEGYTNDDNTWEPPTNMVNCLAMLHSYILTKVLPQVKDRPTAKLFEKVLPPRLRKVARATCKKDFSPRQSREETTTNKKKLKSDIRPNKYPLKIFTPKSLTKDLQLCENSTTQSTTEQENWSRNSSATSNSVESPRHYNAPEYPLSTLRSPEPSPITEARSSSHSSNSSSFNDGCSMRLELSITPESSTDDHSRSPSPVPLFSRNATPKSVTINGHVTRNFLLMPKSSAPMPLPRLRRRIYWPTPVPTRAAKHLMTALPNRPKRYKRHSLPAGELSIIKQVIKENDTERKPSTDLVPPKKVTVLNNHNGSLASLSRMPDGAADILYQQRLAEWECELNRQRDEMDAPIFVENEVDRGEPPLEFRYISSNIYCPGVPDPSDPDVYSSLCGCQCYSLGKKCGSKSATYCCPNMADAEYAYTKAGKIQVKPGTPIYECNSKCACPLMCGNRVVQKGRTIPLCIFRTNNGRGWGVKTKQPIKANTFVTEYVGEVITSEEAEKRG